MRVTLVADNTSSLNWGCRATSFALRELLSRSHEIVGTITRAQLSAPLTIDARIPNDLHSRLVHKLRRPRISRMPVVGSIVFKSIDSLGRYEPPTHDVTAYADLMLEFRDRSPKARQIVSAIEDCDAIVVNGEGEMIFSSTVRPTLLQTLAICQIAKRLGKQVFYVNGMISKGPRGDVLFETVEATARTLTETPVAVRDHQSLDVAAELLPSWKPAFYADSLFQWHRHFQADATSPYDSSRLLPWFDRTGFSLPPVANGPFVAISGSSEAAKSPARATETYTALAEGLKALGIPLLLVATCIGDRFLKQVSKNTGLSYLPVETPIMAGAAVMANARLLVSGRWHPSIMASLGGTPCVFMSSNSHKTLSLQYLLDYDSPEEYRALPQSDDISAIVARSRRLLSEGVDRRAQIVSTSRVLSESALALRDFIR